MKKGICLIALGVLFVSSTAFGAGIDLTGIGARAQGLAGNYRAISNDWSAMHWNPAGMVFAENWLTAGLSLEFITPVAGYAPAKSLAGQNFSATRPGETKNEPKTFLVPSGGIYLNSGKFAFGLGVWAPFGLGAQWDLLNTAAYNAQFPKFDWEDDLQLIDIHPTVAYKISDKLSIGVGASIILADFMIKQPIFTPNPYIYSPAIAELKAHPLLGPTVTNALTALAGAGGLDSPYDHILSHATLEGDGMGLGVNFGLMFKPAETLSIGLSGSWYNDLDIEGTVKAKTYLADNPAAHQVVSSLKQILDTLLAMGEIDATTYAALLGYYSGAVVDRDMPENVTAVLPLPSKLGIGFAYTGIENLILSADFAWTTWSDWKTIEVKDDVTDENVFELKENWEDGLRLGIGAEYRAMGKLTLRGGFYTEPQAAIAETMTPAIPDAGRRWVGVFGLQVPVGPVTIHGSVEKMWIGDMSVEEWQLTEDEEDYDNMAGLYTMDALNFMVGLDYNF